MLTVQFVLQLTLQIPVDDAVVPTDTQDVLFGRTDGDVEHICSVRLEQGGFDVWGEVELLVLVGGFDAAQFDGADVGVPAGGECEAAVVGEREVLDEVAVFALAFVDLALVAVRVGADHADCFVAGGGYYLLDVFQELWDFDTGYLVAVYFHLFF